MLYVWMAALCVAAVVVVAAVSRRFQVGDAIVRTPAGRTEMLAALYRQRRVELAAETDAQGVAADDAAALQAELDSSLVAEYGGFEGRAFEGQVSGNAISGSRGGDALQAANGNAPDLTAERTTPGDSASQGQPGIGWRTAAALAVLLPTFAVALYLSGATSSEPQAADLAGVSAVMSLNPETESAELASLAKVLTQRVHKHADDAESWYLLGHARLKMRDYGGASAAFAAAHALQGPDTNIDIFWLQARYLAAGGALDDTARAIAERVLQSAPGHPLVMQIFAIDAFRRGAYDEAVTQLNRALSVTGDLQQQAQLVGGIREARKQMGNSGPGIDLHIQAAQSPPLNASIFVIARPVGGGMPFAVARRPAALLPLDVRLDDAVSMNPAMPLSLASEVEVVVRLSLSGRAMPEAGDWQWVSEPMMAANSKELVNVVLAPPAG